MPWCATRSKITKDNTIKNQILELKSYNNKAHKQGVSFITSVGSNNIDLATAGYDGLIKLWNIDKGICME